MAKGLFSLRGKPSEKNYSHLMYLEVQDALECPRNDSPQLL